MGIGVSVQTVITSYNWLPQTLYFQRYTSISSVKKLTINVAAGSSSAFSRALTQIDAPKTTASTPRKPEPVVAPIIKASKRPRAIKTVNWLKGNLWLSRTIHHIAGGALNRDDKNRCSSNRPCKNQAENIRMDNKN